MKKICVLWIDDQPNEAFVDAAFEQGIDIQVKTNVDDGAEELIASKSYDAIILDANCVMHRDGSQVPDISALGYALRRITEIENRLPWFVYSGGGFSGETAIDIIVKGYDRPYDSMLWYKKPLQMNQMFIRIKEVVSKSKEYKLKQRYDKEFEAANIVEDADRLLLEGLMFEYTADPKNIQDYFNPIRKIVENVFSKCQQCGYLPSSVSLNGTARLLENPGIAIEGYSLKKSIMDKALAHSLGYILDITQDASHDKSDLLLGVTEYVRKRKNANLYRSVLYIAMDLLLWLSELIQTNPDPNNIEIKSIHKGEVQKYQINNKTYYYSGKYQLQYRDGLTDGATVIVMNYIQNSNPFLEVDKFVSIKNYEII